MKCQNISISSTCNTYPPYPSHQLLLAPKIWEPRDQPQLGSFPRRRRRIAERPWELGWLGRSSSTVPQGPFKTTKNPRHRVEFVQQIVDSFWKRWTKDVFPLLIPRKKWNVERRNVRINDVVMTVDENAVRRKWSIGRILNVHPGRDGKVRNVTLRTPVGVYRRPITKIAVIYPAEGYEDSKE